MAAPVERQGARRYVSGVSDADLDIDTSICTHMDAIPSEPLTLGTSGPTLRPLRRLDSGALRSGVVDVPSGWSSETPLRVATTLQMFLVTGALRIGGKPAAANGFVLVRAGGVLPVMVADSDTRLILINDGEQAWTPAEAGDDAEVTPDVMAVEPIVPVVAGRVLTGFERRVLWIDPETGADTRLLRVPGGFEGKGPSWHPVQEEIFLLEGDIAPDDGRPMRPGSFLWNPARSVHGFHEHSRGGCTLLEWHDGLWSVTLYEGATGTAGGTA